LWIDGGILVNLLVYFFLSEKLNKFVDKIREFFIKEIIMRGGGQPQIQTFAKLSLNWQFLF